MTTDQEWERKIGRRLRLRDLHLVFAVADYGSMAKAAESLRVTQSAVSQIIAEVEQELGVWLVDHFISSTAARFEKRSRRGAALEAPPA